MSRSVNWFLFAHVLTALWLAGGVFAGAVVRAQTKRAATLGEKIFGLRLSWRLMTVFGIPGSVVSGAIGFHLVGARGLSWTMEKGGWLHASVGLWVVVLLLTLAVLVPQLKRTIVAAERSYTQGAPTMEFKKLTAVKWPSYVADLNAVAVVVLTLLMVLKPF